MKNIANQVKQEGRQKKTPFLHSLPKSPLCFDLLSKNTLAQQTIANYPVAK
jgi:hypothetical protein